jgi:O-antigen ligase
LQGNETRLILWNVSTKVCLKHPFGVGLGNLDFYMNQELNAVGHGQLAAKQNNPHNQFIQIAAEIGIVGLALFVFIIAYLFVIALHQKRLILFSLVLSFIIFCLFESMIQRQSGIIFFCYWFAIFSRLDEKNRFVL